ncbi:hypothetical protein [Steroidobacter cummioxidans]|uniref:hypothetical protein n=1 Tax=Steroidobacter cummioxidans TaxID=1803913 RepID=UPI000E31C3C9|nr:hypothetical protein [Steroidobacter cummioxidans]
MSYTLQAMVGSSTTIVALGEDGATRVELSGGLAMIPLTGELRNRFGISSLPLTDDEAEPILPDSLSSLCLKFSQHGLVAYLEAEIFGGVGLQAYVLFRDGAMLGAPVRAVDAINQALRHLGVRSGSNRDEFDAVGLGRHRDTDEWASDAVSRAVS